MIRSWIKEVKISPVTITPFGIIIYKEGNEEILYYPHTRKICIKVKNNETGEIKRIHLDLIKIFKIAHTLFPRYIMRKYFLMQYTFAQPCLIYIILKHLIENLEDFIFSLLEDPYKVYIIIATELFNILFERKSYFVFRIKRGKIPIPTKIVLESEKIEFPCAVIRYSSRVNKLWIKLLLDTCFYKVAVRISSTLYLTTIRKFIIRNIGNNYFIYIFRDTLYISIYIRLDNLTAYKLIKILNSKDKKHRRRRDIILLILRTERCELLKFVENFNMREFLEEQQKSLIAIDVALLHYLRGRVPEKAVTILVQIFYNTLFKIYDELYNISLECSSQTEAVMSLYKIFSTITARSVYSILVYYVLHQQYIFLKNKKYMLIIFYHNNLLDPHMKSFIYIADNTRSKIVKYYETCYFCAYILWLISEIARTAPIYYRNGDPKLYRFLRRIMDVLLNIIEFFKNYGLLEEKPCEIFQIIGETAEKFHAKRNIVILETKYCVWHGTVRYKNSKLILHNIEDYKKTVQIVLDTFIKLPATKDLYFNSIITLASALKSYA